MKRKNFNIDKKYIGILFILCLVINIGGKWVASSLHLPFWFDCIGTFVMACCFGPVAGAITAFITTIIFCFLFSTNIFFVVTSISTAIVVGLFFSKEYVDYFQVVCTAAITSITSITISTPLNMILNQGIIENIWGDALYDMLLQNGNSNLFSFVLGIGFVEFPDKVLSLFIAVGLLKLLHHAYTSHKKKEESR